MGLTRPRAHQLQDSDFKSSCRAITTSNITLSGGAPATVDGVSLALQDRVLVTGQSTGAENGIYRVTTVGTGSNGTWVRAQDADADGDITAGLTVMVTEGSTYADTSWKLTTDDPITVGTTALTFEQASAYGFGTVAVDGTSLVADQVGDTLTITAGNNISLSGNATSDTYSISVSDSPTFTGNITGGNLLTAGGLTTASITATGNIDANNITLVNDISANIFLGAVANVGLLLTDTANVVGNVNGGNVLSSGVVTATGNITGGNIATAGRLSVTGNVTGGNIIANTSVETPNFTVSDSLTIGSQIIYAQGANGFSVNEDFDPSNSSTQTAYHFTSGAGRETVAFTLARTAQFTDGFGIYGNAADNTFVMFGEQSNTKWEWRRGVGIRPLDLDGGTLLANLSAAGNFATIGTITGTGNVTGGNLTTAGQVAATGNITGGNITTAGSLSTGLVLGNLIPSANVTYNLGNATNRWNEIFLAGGTINLGNITIKDDGGTMGVFASDGTTPASLGNTSTVVASGNITTTAGYFIGDGSQLTNLPDAGNAFTTLSVSGQSNIVADSSNDTLTLVAGSGISITANATSDTLTFSTVSLEGAFADDADFGQTTDEVTTSEDLGDLASTESTTYDLGTIITAEGLIYPGQLVLPQYTVGTLPSASVTAQLIYVSDETGGATLAFSDGTNWRRVQDRAVVS